MQMDKSGNKTKHFSSVPLACNHQTRPEEQEQPGTNPSPRCSKVCPLGYPYAAVSNTGDESVCA